MNTKAKGILDEARSASTQRSCRRHRRGEPGGRGGALVHVEPSHPTSARWQWQPILGTNVQGLGLSGVW